jgi:Na+/H+ antiporter NhaC
VATIALVTTWIGFQIGLIAPAVAQIPDFNENAYSIFLSSIPYSFYPILAIFFVFLVAYTGRDMGPMYEAEIRARTTGEVFAPGASIDENAAEGGELKPKDDKPKRAVNAILPIVVLVGGVLGGIYATGQGDTLRDIVGSSDSYKALMWASLLGVFVAAALSIGQRILNLEEVVEAWYGGLKAMLFAMIILVLAWSLSDITAVLHTADYLVSVLGETLPPGIVPALVFLLAAATSFATGSSWGTMGILMPLVVPLVWAVLQANGLADPDHYYLMYSTVSCILAGSVWGDHCTPISDTTILSSLASGCDHIDHVRTQLPYAVLVGGVAVLFGTIPTGYGLPAWASILIGIAILIGILRYFGKPVEQGI